MRRENKYIEFVVAVKITNVKISIGEKNNSFVFFSLVSKIITFHFIFSGGGERGGELFLNLVFLLREHNKKCFFFDIIVPESSSF